MAKIKMRLVRYIARMIGCTEAINREMYKGLIKKNQEQLLLLITQKEGNEADSSR